VGVGKRPTEYISEERVAFDLSKQVDVEDLAGLAEEAATRCEVIKSKTTIGLSGKQKVASIGDISGNCLSWMQFNAHNGITHTYAYDGLFRPRRRPGFATNSPG
jgi:hypothetical protein